MIYIFLVIALIFAWPTYGISLIIFCIVSTIVIGNKNAKYNPNRNNFTTKK